jgi:hypothetical protein
MEADPLIVNQPPLSGLDVKGNEQVPLVSTNQLLG